MKISQTRASFGLIGILLLGFAIRLSIWAYVLDLGEQTRFTTSDSPSYYASAQVLLETGSFSLSPEQPDIPETTRTPGYPAFIVGVYALLGKSLDAIVLAQVILSPLMIALGFRLGWMMGSRRVGFLVALLMCVDLPLIAYSLMILSEYVFVSMLLLFSIAGLRFLASEEWYWILLTGLCLSLATLIRPVTYYLLPLLICGLLIWTLKQSSPVTRRSLVRNIALLSLPSLIFVGAWQYRNFRLTGHAYVSQIQGINMLLYRGADIVAQREGINRDAARDLILQADHRELRQDAIQHPEKGISSEWSRMGAELILDHPILYARSAARGVALTLIAPGEGVLTRILGLDHVSGPLGDLRDLAPTDYVQKWILGNPVPFALFLFAILELGVIYLGIGLWFLYAIRYRGFSISSLWLLGIAIYLLLISAGPEAGARFRVQLMPTLIVFGMLGLDQWFAIRREKSALNNAQ